MKISTNFEPVRIASGRFVGFGHEVTNFGHRAVVVGLHQHGLLVRLLDASGKMEPVGVGQYTADPDKCH